MKKYTITNADASIAEPFQLPRPVKRNVAAVNVVPDPTPTERRRLLNVFARGEDDMQVSDGYHTMDELYEHRIGLFLALCRTMENNHGPRVWKSKLHHDGTMYPGQFILGIFKEPGEQITYHIPLSRWDDIDFVEVLDRAPEWDGHTPAEALQRINQL